ncbi:uncharacterized protein [Macrobrachium rosenbergii]|uniref:uncharacterized protein isoform X2 n=1 Tax=Macrobrachium rosenbergii TaxID=79674 RepID=UPI0034D5846D
MNWEEELTGSVRHHLSGLCEEKVQQVVTHLIEVTGVESMEDTSLVTEADLTEILKPLQSRKLIAGWKPKGSGTPVLQANQFMVAVDGRVINSDLTSLVAAMSMVFAAYYIFGIHYPSEASVTLEFMQRCFFKINPEKGTKNTRTKKKVAHTHPRILKFIAEFSAFELME